MESAIANILILLLIVAAFASSSSSSSSGFPSPSHPRCRHRSSEKNGRGFWIADDKFWKDGRPFQIIGGDVHYFRVHPHYWKDRLLRAKALGLNTIQTYVAWNLHEPKPEKWNFEGIADVLAYLNLAQELGFLVMLRVGPYICAEWDLGGFPAWLLAVEPALVLRSSDSAFLRFVERWWGVLLPKLVPLLYENGGPIIMVQVENEYGSYGNDKAYLRHLVTLARNHLGYQIILYTTDGGTRDTLEKGAIPEEGVFSAVDFTTGDDPWPIFNLQKFFNLKGKSPPLSAEFYTGWLTHWGEQNAETDAISTARALEMILSQNGSAVLYMAHGGTNFGFYNGANTGQNESDYKADLTSYDYDAPIKEFGDVNNLKYKALRSVIQKYSGRSLPPPPRDNEKANFGPIAVGKIAALFELLNETHYATDVVESEKPLTMESVGQMFGFALYVSAFTPKGTSSILTIQKVHDRAQVFLSCPTDQNGGIPRFVGVVERWSNSAIEIPNLHCSFNITLIILVENLGRVNYGPYLHDKKGILSDVTIDGIALHSWKIYPISFQRLGKILKAISAKQVFHSSLDKLLSRSRLADASSKFQVSVKENDLEQPAFYEGRFYIDPGNQIKDTFISFHGWNKGVAFVNDFNIGRYWPMMGPQCTLFVPAPILQHGVNIVVILELHKPNPNLALNLVGEPDFTCGSKIRLK